MGVRGNGAAVLCAVVIMAVTGRTQAAEDAGKWETEIVGGVSVTDGNSETLLVNGGVAVKRVDTPHELNASVGGKYGESTVRNADGEDVTDKTAETVQAEASYKFLWSERAYAYGKGTYLYDGIADVDYRVIVGPGVGYYLVKDDARSLSVELGVPYLAERVGGEDNDVVTLRVAERFEQKLSEGARIWQSVEYLPETSEFGRYLLNAEVGADAALTGALSLRVVAQNRYDSEPAADRQKNDFTLTAGVVVKL